MQAAARGLHGGSAEVTKIMERHLIFRQSDARSMPSAPVRGAMKGPTRRGPHKRHDRNTNRGALSPPCFIRNDTLSFSTVPTQAASGLRAAAHRIALAFRYCMKTITRLYRFRIASLLFASVAVLIALASCGLAGLTRLDAYTRTQYQGNMLPIAQLHELRTASLDARREFWKSVRESDTVARLGGDEFVVVLEEVGGMQQIDLVARAVLTAVNRPIALRSSVVSVTPSIGISLFPDDAANTEQLLLRADRAMYFAKNTGKNNLCFFSTLEAASHLQPAMTATA